MKTVVSILITVGMLVLASYIENVLNIGCIVSILMVIGTSIWMAIDSKNIELKKYKSFISMGPVSVFLCGVIFWVITFPCYLAVRFKIKDGKSVLKDKQQLDA